LNNDIKMQRTTRWKPDVNECEFDLTFQDGELIETKALKLDPRLENMTDEEAYEVTKADCIAKTNRLLSAQELLNDEQKEMIGAEFDENRNLIILTNSKEIKAILDLNLFKTKLV